MPQTGIHSVTIPGAVAAWSMLSERFGRLPLGDVLAPAIRIAEEGFPVAGDHRGGMGRQRGAPAGRPRNPRASTCPAAGRRASAQMFRNPDLAATYRALAAEGRDAFYRGDIARRIVSCSARHGGALTAADLADYDAEWVTPLSTTYRGWTVYELPPNGQGIAALMMLNLLEHAPIGSYGHNSAEALHTLIEAKKLAYADMARHVCDPAFHTVPVEAHAVEGVRRAARARDRSGARQPRGRARHAADARRRHDLSERRRSRRQHGVAHSEQLRELRIGPRARGRGIRAAEPRRAVHAGSRRTPTRSRRASVRSTRSFPAS